MPGPLAYQTSSEKETESTKMEEEEEEEEEAGEALSITTVVDLWSKQVVSYISTVRHICPSLCVCGRGCSRCLPLQCDH